MKKAFNLFLFFLFVFSSCKYTLTKEQYLTNYESFIQDVKQNYQKYSNETWKKQDKGFVKYNEELFLQFKDKLTLAEQVRLTRFDFVYNLMRGNITFADLVSGKYNQAISNYLSELTSVLTEATLIKKDIKDVISLDLLNKLLSTNN